VYPYYITTLIPKTNTTRTTGNGTGTGKGTGGAAAWRKKLPPPPPPPAYQCQEQPDYFSSANYALDTSFAVNLTCWTTAPAADKRSSCIDRGSAWFRTADHCYIPDYIINTRVKVPESTRRGQMEELTDILRYCPPPLHQVGAIRKRYRDGTYCYQCPTLDCNSLALGPGNGSVELDCWTTGQAVRGDE
jgi:hypothetical protein